MIAAALALLKSLSWQAYVMAALALAAGGIYVTKTVDIDVLKHQLAAMTKDRDGLKNSIALAKALATETAASEAASMKDISNESQRLVARARADAAVPSHDRLLERAAAVASAGPAASAPEGSASASGPGILLADVLRKSDERSGQLAAYADQARIAGDACVSAYEALKPIESERGDDDK